MSNVNSTFDQLLKEIDQFGLSRYVQFIDGQYELVSPVPNENNLRLNFNLLYANHLSYFKQHSIKKDLLAKALGLKKVPPNLHVLDLTCGLGGDSLLMLSLGFALTSLERHPLPKLIVQSAYDHFDHPDKNRWTLFPDSVRYEDFDVVFYDPMFGEHEGDNLPKKKMRIFRSAIGMDNDAKEVAHDLRIKVKRLVIKRPKKSEVLLENPSWSYPGKAIRYDVYW